jgi:hypothetical protein
MWSLWQQLADADKVRDRTMRGLTAWVAAQTEPAIERLQFLTPAQEDNVIERLKNWLER